MAVLVTDPGLEEELVAQRRLSGGDRFDEVWEGVYMMAPLADDEHQDLQLALAAPIRAVGLTMRARVRAGANISDRETDWRSNFRCPDVVVFLPGTKAKNRKSHWFGGPDFAIEIISPHDRSREKFPFYAKVGVRELLLVDRHPWALELYTLANNELVLKGQSTLSGSEILESTVLPLSFRLIPGPERPQVEILHHDQQQRWLA